MHLDPLLELSEAGFPGSIRTLDNYRGSETRPNHQTRGGPCSFEDGGSIPGEQKRGPLPTRPRCCKFSSIYLESFLLLVHGSWPKYVILLTRVSCTLWTVAIDRVAHSGTAIAQKPPRDPYAMLRRLLQFEGRSPLLLNFRVISGCGQLSKIKVLV